MNRNSSCLPVRNCDTFFRKFIAQADGIPVLQFFCGAEKSIGAMVATQTENELRIRHLRAREQSEEDFFRLYVDATAEHSNPVFLPKGEINSTSNTQKIISAAPDLIVAMAVPSFANLS